MIASREMPGNARPMGVDGGKNHGVRVLISDSHVGTTMWQHAVMERLGHSPFSVSLSRHTSYASPNALEGSWLVRALAFLPKWLVRSIFPFSKISKVRLAICSFPPARILDFLKLPDNVHLILNAGHRFHIRLSPKRALAFSKLLEQLFTDQRVTIAAMSEYDFH